MRLTTGFIPTVKETPTEAVIPSHKLMIRAGMIRMLSAGIYSFLPLGYRVMKKVSEIVREEMDAIGGQELHLPALSPRELWEQTGRVKAFGETLFHLRNRPLVLAPTHEEVICWIAKNHISSYRDLPQIWYQIQTKFRNEPRPRSGVLRGRQFLMKDSYSLDGSWEGLDRSYDLHDKAYRKIFERCGLRFFIVGASSGAMGGSKSQEFMMESEAGEDVIAISEDGSYAANLEIASSVVSPAGAAKDSAALKEVHTPNIRTIDQVATFLKVGHTHLAKSLAYEADGQPILVLMLGNDELNEAKLNGVVGEECHPIDPERLKDLTGADPGSIGPVGLKKFRILADKRLEGAKGLVSGANKNDYHLANIDLERDCNVEGYFDFRTVMEGEDAPDGSGKLRIVKGVELGHIFKLGTKYSDALGATFLNEDGRAQSIIMGSYGIGIERIIACHIEQNHDEFGIVWDKGIAPFQAHLILVGAKNREVNEAAEEIYSLLLEEKIEVLFDDRHDISPGFKFKDADLLGMPYQIIVGEKNFSNGKIEIKERRTGSRELVEKNQILSRIKELLST